METRRHTLCIELAIMLLVLSLQSCPPDKRARGEITNAQKRLYQTMLRIGTVEINAEIARTDAERQSGLMFRTKLADGEGMLFVYDRDTRMSFWMKNTGIPLSIAFISADGLIREIRDMNPFSLSPVASEFSVRYALETPQGWFARVGIKPGDRMLVTENLAHYVPGAP